MKNFLSTLFLLPWFALQAAVPSTLNEALIIPDDTLQYDHAGKFISECILHTDDWNSYREKLRNDWLSIIGEWPNVISGKKLQYIGEPERLDHGIDRYRVSLEWLPDVVTEGYLLIPGSRGVKPAVITFFYEPETSVGIGGKPCRDFALQLARCGFVTLSLGSTETTEAKTYGIYYPSIDNPVMESLSAMAYAAANAYEALALETEVDADRIGVLGHSYGGKWAMFASCLYDKFACAAWGDPGIVLDETKGGYINYWEPWYLGWRPRPWSDTWNPEGFESPYGAYKKLKE